MRIKNKITDLFKIEHPIIQGGMVWVSGWKLAKAVSENGGLGLIGAGSMKPELLAEHIQKIKQNCQKPFGVNLPLFRGDIEELISVVITESVKIVFTSAGNPGKYTEMFKQKGIKVVHVVANLKQALKAESVYCDAIVAEGVEAGGHNGADEIPLSDLIIQLANEVKIPIIAAGGIVDKHGIEKAISLGASGVQIGTLFAASVESSAHINYKEAIVKAGENDTALFFKSIGLIRAIVNPFVEKAILSEKKNVPQEELVELLGSKREMLGIFNGNLEEGILEAGTGVGKITSVKSVADIFRDLVNDSSKNSLT